MKTRVAIALFCIAIFGIGFVFLYSKPRAIEASASLVEQFEAETTVEGTEYFGTYLTFLRHPPFLAWVSEYYFPSQFSGPPFLVHVDLFGHEFDSGHWTDYYTVKATPEIQRIEQGSAGQPEKRRESIDSPD